MCSDKIYAKININMHFYIKMRFLLCKRPRTSCRMYRPQTIYWDFAHGPHWGDRPPDLQCVESKKFLKLNYVVQ